MFWRWCLKLLLDNFINSHRSQDQHHAYQWFIVYVFIFVDTSFIHRLAAPLKETSMFRDSICSSACQKKCSISDRQSADILPDSSNSAVESVRKIVKSALQMKWQSFNMPFGLLLILHPANSFKKGKVPIVKQMLPVMVRSVCATKYSVEHLRHFKHKTIAKFLLETTISVRKSGISWRKSHWHLHETHPGWHRWLLQAMDVSQNGSAQKKQWLYSGDTKVFVIRIMLISLFSPGARQSFFSTITYKVQDIIVCTCTVCGKSTR